MTQTTIPFLAGGGRATELVEARDWSTHPLGAPDQWPEGLKTALSLVVNSPESMILCWGPDLHFFFNTTYIPLLGPRVEWAMGARFDEVWADALEQAMPIVNDAMAGRSQRFNDLPWKLATDRGVADTWWTFSYSRILGADGEPAGLFIFTNETTQKVLSEAARQEADRKLIALAKRQEQSLQQMPGFVAILSGPEHRFDYVNDAYVEISGLREFLGRSVREVFPEIGDQGFFELLDQVYTTGKAFHALAMPIQLNRESGDRFIDLIYDPLRDENGEIVGIFVGGYDVTERIVAERGLAEANTSLEQRVEAAIANLTATEDALRQSQKMDAVGQLTGGLAHDFNNLLAGISGSLELMQARIAQGRFSDVERYLAAAQAASHRAAALTHRLLAFSRRQTLDPRPINANDLVLGMDELIRRTVGPDIRIDVVREAKLWSTLADPPQLENALLNLCINARDAMPEGGAITIATNNLALDKATARQFDLPVGDFVSLSVTDTGAGMTPDIVAKAFEPFFTTKPLGQGTGLGLSMVYGFAQQSGGQVRIQSEVGAGTSVTIYLPRHHGEAESQTGVSTSSTSSHAGAGETVLVVDDEPILRMLVVDALTEAGYTPIEAGDGAAGLKVLDSNIGVDLLITDVGLPGGMNGRQLADAARARRPDLRVLFITGYAETALVKNGRLEPGTAVLTKPFAIEVLGARVREMLSSS